MKYCSSCGQKVVRQIPPGDTRERFVCSNCGVVHYQNPKIVTGCLPILDDRVLMCRRAIEPRKGRWTLPAGFLELGETAESGAERETWEEALAHVKIEGLYTIFNLPHISQIHMFFRASLIDGTYGIGEESIDVRLFEEHTIPWDELAFPVVTKTLRYYFDDRPSAYPVRIEDIMLGPR